MGNRSVAKSRGGRRRSGEDGSTYIKQIRFRDFGKNESSGKSEIPPTSYCGGVSSSSTKTFFFDFGFLMVHGVGEEREC